MMCRRVHQQHAKKHYVTSDTTGLCVVDFDGSNRPNLGFLDIKEAVEGDKTSVLLCLPALV